MFVSIFYDCSDKHLSYEVIPCALKLQWHQNNKSNKQLTLAKVNFKKYCLVERHSGWHFWVTLVWETTEQQAALLQQTLPAQNSIAWDPKGGCEKDKLFLDIPEKWHKVHVVLVWIMHLTEERGRNNFEYLRYNYIFIKHAYGYHNSSHIKVANNNAHATSHLVKNQANIMEHIVFLLFDELPSISPKTVCRNG